MTEAGAGWQCTSGTARGLPGVRAARGLIRLGETSVRQELRF